jgi:hypothetical protein
MSTSDESTSAVLRTSDALGTTCVSHSATHHSNSGELKELLDTMVSLEQVLNEDPFNLQGSTGHVNSQGTQITFDANPALGREGDKFLCDCTGWREGKVCY